jgi:hypothetical protein
MSSESLRHPVLTEALEMPAHPMPEEPRNGNNIGPLSRSPDFLAGGGEMGALMRAKNWADTPLGTPESWPLAPLGNRALTAGLTGGER